MCNHNLVLCSKWYCVVQTASYLVCLGSCGYFSYSLDSNYSQGGKSLKMCVCVCVKKVSVKMQRKSLSLATKMNDVKTTEAGQHQFHVCKASDIAGSTV